jgi:SAM-dependent methyltransferase
MANLVLPWRHNPAPPQGTYPDEIIRALYLTLLGRAPDEEGLQAYTALARQGRWADVFGGIAHSSEFRSYWLALRDYDWCNDPALRTLQTPEVAALSARLRGCETLSWDSYSEHLEAILARPELVIGQAEYLPVHARRFHELFNAALILLEGKAAPRILEFGVSEISRLYLSLLPQASLVTADRPAAPDYPGFRAETCLRVTGGDAHAEVDLERMLPDTHPILAQGGFDLIVFTEVLEHLDTHPVPLLLSLGRLLAPDGYLYLTTPNFFRAENLAHLHRRENPAHVYPAGKGNWDAHHHHREYALGELLGFAEEAELRVAACYFSDCWDMQPVPEAERSNLVVVLQNVPNRD